MKNNLGTVYWFAHEHQHNRQLVECIAALSKNKEGIKR